MKRDLDLIRKTILEIEDAPSGRAPDLAIEGYSPAQVRYHAYLIVDAGLARGKDVTTMDSDGPEALITNLSWAGHEFAEAAREETRWKNAMRMVKEKGGTVTLDVLTQLLGILMRGAFGLP